MMRLIAMAIDGLAVRNIARLAAALDVEVTQVTQLDQIEDDERPAAVVIDLEMDGGLAAVAAGKGRWPEAMLIGLVTMPDRAVWQRAEQAGCDLVTTRGALAKSVPEKLMRWMEFPGGRRIRLFALADVAGRLGVVDRIEDADVGPLAVYQVAGEIRVARDRCPHAGARLSYGEVSVDDGVVTCPEHGSRFDLGTGARLRGPADEGLDTFRVAIEEGQAFLLLDPP